MAIACAMFGAGAKAEREFHEASRHIVNAEVLSALGPRGVLVSVARGTLVDETALIEALRSGTILAAGLDVFENEPHVPAELIALDNAVLLPHVGSASLETRRAVAECVVANLVAWSEDRPPLSPVPETPWRDAGARRIGRRRREKGHAGAGPQRGNCTRCDCITATRGPVGASS